MRRARLLVLPLAAGLAVAGCATTREGLSSDPGAIQPDETAWPYDGVLQDGTTFRLARRIADKVRTGEAIEYVASLASPGDSPFGAQFRAGHETALADPGLRYPMNGTIDEPETGSALGVDAQVSRIDELLLGAGVDCLTIQPAAPEGLAVVVNRVLAAGIPVFTVGLAAGGNELAALAPDTDQEAAAVAQALVAWAKDAKVKLRTFALSAADPESPVAVHRMRAFRDAVQDAIPKATFITTEEDALATTANAARAREAYAAFLAANPDVQLVLSADAGAAAAVRAIRDAGLAGRAFAAGWSVDPAQLDAIEGGDQVLAVDERWSAQGAFGPAACASLLAGGTPEPATLEPIVVTRANVAATRAELAGAAP